MDSPLVRLTAGIATVMTALGAETALGGLGIAARTTFRPRQRPGRILPGITGAGPAATPRVAGDLPHKAPRRRSPGRRGRPRPQNVPTPVVTRNSPAAVRRNRRLQSQPHCPNRRPNRRRPTPPVPLAPVATVAVAPAPPSPGSPFRRRRFDPPPPHWRSLPPHPSAPSPALLSPLVGRADGNRPPRWCLLQPSGRAGSRPAVPGNDELRPGPSPAATTGTTTTVTWAGNQPGTRLSTRHRQSFSTSAGWDPPSSTSPRSQDRPSSPSSGTTTATRCRTSRWAN